MQNARLNFIRNGKPILANLLTDMEFSDDKIQYEPISIRPERQRDGAVHTATSQRIRLELNNFEQLK